jgi:hypothetical protein
VTYLKTYFDEADALGRVEQDRDRNSATWFEAPQVEAQIEDAEQHLKALKQEKHKLGGEHPCT